MVSQSSKLIIFLENFTTIIPFDEILSLTFDVGPFKMNIYDIRQKSILWRAIKRTHIIKTHLRGNKLKG